MYRLKQDVVIPKGTLLDDWSGERLGLAYGWAGKVIGLTKDTSGYFLYGLDECDEDLDKWIEEVKEDEGSG